MIPEPHERNSMKSTFAILGFSISSFTARRASIADASDNTGDLRALAWTERHARENDRRIRAAERRGALAEQARCREIFDAPAAEGRMALAVRLVIDTRISSAAAIEILEVAGREQGGSAWRTPLAKPQPPTHH